MHIKTLGQQLRVGDIVFIHIDILPFRKIAKDTKSWTNHVGIVVDMVEGEPLIAESTFPFSKKTSFTKFIRRSKENRVAVKRFPEALTQEQQERIRAAAQKRIGRFYDTGFNLRSRKQFCSRYVYEVVREALGIQLGKVENLKAIFTENPKADLKFWKIWYFGKIPWQRETITPASLLNAPELHTVFDGHADIDNA